MFDDPIVLETRLARESYAAKFGYDLAAIVADLRSRQGLDGRQLVRRPPQAPFPRNAAAKSEIVPSR